MAKDGTARGGQRPGAGAKKKPLADKILEGKARPSLQIVELDPPENLEGFEMPKVADWMVENQQVGIDLNAAEIFEDTWAFIVRMQCERFVAPQIVRHYAMEMARWIQCERAISKFGLLAKHPTTGGAMASPYVQMSREYSKQANAAWYQITAIIKEHSESVFDAPKAQSDQMERLLVGLK